MGLTATDRRPVRRIRRKRPNYWLRRLVVLSLLLIPIAAWRGWAYVHEAWLTIPVPAPEKAAPVVAGQPVYVVVLGVDERTEDAGRADTLLLLRLAPDRQSADLVNIPRDTWVTYSNGSQGKINAAYSNGGPTHVASVVANLLGLPARPYYVQLNLQAFVEIVDALGGVTIDVDKHYLYEDPYQDLVINIRAGPQLMDGQTALKFVRLRYDGVTNDDIGRIKRQQQFIAAVQKKVLSPAYLSKLPGLLNTVRQHVKTNIPESDQLNLAQEFFKARANLRMERLPGAPNDETGDWILDPLGWQAFTKSWTSIK